VLARSPDDLSANVQALAVEKALGRALAEGIAMGVRAKQRAKRYVKDGPDRERRMKYVGAAAIDLALLYEKAGDCEAARREVVGDLSRLSNCGAK